MIATPAYLPVEGVEDGAPQGSPPASLLQDVQHPLPVDVMERGLLLQL